MKTLKESIKKLQAWNTEFENVDNIQVLEKLSNELDEAKVYVPVIGKFSAGKSALINCLIGRPVLVENISPETALPTEIKYTKGSSKCVYILSDSSEIAIPINKIREKSPDDAAFMQIYLGDDILSENHFLKQIPDVVIVDMPGFESGYEVHDKAIDAYIRKSVAYVLTFSADEPILSQSMKSLLEELRMAEKPIGLVVTKCDKKTSESDVAINHLQESVQKIVGKDSLDVYETSSLAYKNNETDGGIEEVKGYFNELQRNSQSILRNAFKGKVRVHGEQLLSYLQSLKKNTQLSESELKEKKSALEKEIKDLEIEVREEQQQFANEIHRCSEDIINHVENYLSMSTDSFANTLANGGSIDSQISSGVRMAISEGIHTYFLPVVQQYKKKINHIVSTNMIDDIRVPISIGTDNGSKVDYGGVLATIGILVGKLVKGAGIVGLVLNVVGALISLFKSSSKKDKIEKKEEIKQQLRNNLYPSIINNVRGIVKGGLEGSQKGVNEEIEANIRQQREGLEKALADAINQLHEEESHKEAMLNKIQSVSAEVEGMIVNELQ